jgi:hypothetical protein
MVAVQEWGSALVYVDAALKADRSVVLAAVQRLQGYAYEISDDILKANAEVLQAALWYDANLLQHAPDSLKADRSTVMAAVTIDGRALRFADASLRCDATIVEAATRQMISIMAHQGWGVKLLGTMLSEGPGARSGMLAAGLSSVLVQAMAQGTHPDVRGMSSLLQDSCKICLQAALRGA